MRSDFSSIPYTCPLIDEVLSFMDDISISLPPDLAGEIPHMMAVMEKIRAANDQLRSWGNECFARALDAEDENDHLRGRINDLESDISDLEAEVSQLNEHIIKY